MGGSVLLTSFKISLSSGELKWGDCKVKEGNCGPGTQSSNRLVLVRGNSGVAFQTRNCSVPCSGETVLQERGGLN